MATSEKNKKKKKKSVFLCGEEGKASTGFAIKSNMWTLTQTNDSLIKKNKQKTKSEYWPTQDPYT